MAVLTEADIREAEIITQLRVVPYTNVEFVENTTITEDDTLTIDDEYTSASATATEEIFAGRIEDIDYLDETNAFCRSLLDEINIITPNNISYHQHSYLNVLIELINDLCSVVTLPDAGACIGKYYGIFGWNSQTDGQDPSGWVVTEPGGVDIHIEDDLVGGHTKYCFYDDNNAACDSRLTDTFSANKTSGSMECWFYCNSGGGSNGLRFILSDSAGSDGPWIYIDGTTLWHQTGGGSTVIGSLGGYPQDVWYHLRIDFECGAGVYKGLAADTFDVYTNGEHVGSDLAFYNAQAQLNTMELEMATDGEVYIDAIGYSWDTDYYLGKNINFEQTFFDYPSSNNEYPGQDWVLDGNKTIQRLLNEYADSIGGHWYFNNEDKIYCNDCSTDSGFDITTSTDLIYISGQKQIKQIDQVILLGGWTSAGIRLKVTSGAGNNVFSDTYAHITDTDILQEIADNILTNKQLHPVTLSVSILDAVKGMFQVGETITIGASLIFSNTTKAVPTGQYIIRQCIFNQLSKVCELILDDGIVFQGTKDLGEENSELIRQNREDIENDDSYSSSWNGVTIPPSQNAVYDKIELLLAHLMIGSTNREYIPCAGTIRYGYPVVGGASFGIWGNSGANDIQLVVNLPLPTNRGGKKLYIDAIRLLLTIADANDYVDIIYMFGNTGSTQTDLYNDGTNQTLLGAKDYTFTAVDCSGYDSITIVAMGSNTDAFALRFSAVLARCYYDD